MVIFTVTITSSWPEFGGAIVRINVIKINVDYQENR
jgi:hypothetical protein